METTDVKKGSMTILWMSLSDDGPPEVGTWVLMYLNKYMGVDKYRTGMYMGSNDWMSAANWNEPRGLLNDADVMLYAELPGIL